jgi:hypothetical protein
MKPLFYTIGDSFTRGVRTDEVNTDERDKFHAYKGTLGSFGDWIFKDLNRRFNRHINLSAGGYDNKSIIRTCKLLRENLIKNDFVLIAMTNPSRGQRKDMSNKDVITLITNQIQEIQEILDGYNYLITFAFSSLVPYWTSPRILNRKIKDSSRIIEWTKPNNTLHDICSGTWLEEYEINPLMSEASDENGNVSINHSIGFNDPNRFNPYHNLGRNFCRDSHPSTDGHELIASVLKPYIIEALDS